MEPSYGRLPIRRVLATAGIGAIAVGLSVAGALPVMAASGGNGNGNGNSSHSSNTGNTNSNGNGGSSHNPPGNNGTVFIHDVAGDHSPHNVPHVGCTFYVDFFGFDSGQVLSTHFVGQAPTGKDVPLPDGDWTGTMPNNNASGAGNDFDWEQPFTLDTSVLGAPQPQQGYHVKLTVSTGEPGGVKHKVFWIAPCQSSTSSSSSTTSSRSSTSSTETVSTTSTHTSTHTSTSSSTTSTTTSTTQTATVIGTSTSRSTTTGTSSSTSSAAPVSSTTTSSSSSTPETVVVSGTTTSSAAGVLGEQFHRGNNGGTPTQVLGEQFHKAPASTSRALPFTGAPVGQLLLMGLVTVATGAFLALGFRRRGRHAR